MKKQKELKKTIKELRKLRRNPPPEVSVEELEAISYALDWLEEDFLENKKE